MSTTLFGMEVRVNPLFGPGDLLMISGNGQHGVAARLVDGVPVIAGPVEVSRLKAAAPCNNTHLQPRNHG